MKIELKKPICFFDLETTGIDVGRDRIVEISIHKLYPDGQREESTFLVNPGIPIPKGASDIHGITDDKIKGCPGFAQIAPEIIKILADSDIAGYNSNKFDIPILAEELLRAGVDFDLRGRNAIDVQNIFHKKEQRTLSAAYRFYCQKELEGAHGASADTAATLDIFLAQLEHYPDLPQSAEGLAEYTTVRQSADFAGFIAYDASGEEVLNFGKNKGRRLIDLLENDPGYCSWIENADFPLYTKKIIADKRSKMLHDKFNKK